jgi:hypothetical protein
MFGIGGGELLVLLVAVGILLLVPGVAAFGLGYLGGKKAAPASPDPAAASGPATASGPAEASVLPHAHGQDGIPDE